MSDKMQALGRRWAALGLEWLPGMLACGPWRVLTVATDGYPMSMFATAHHRPRGWWGLAGQPGAAREVIPDFSDRLTELALLVHVQQAWADPRAYVMPLSGLHTAGRWAVCGDPPPGVLARMAPDGYPTWAEACIAAVEATR